MALVAATVACHEQGTNPSGVAAAYHCRNGLSVLRVRRWLCTGGLLVHGAYAIWFHQQCWARGLPVDIRVKARPDVTGIVWHGIRLVALEQADCHLHGDGGGLANVWGPMGSLKASVDMGCTIFCTCWLQ